VTVTPQEARAAIDLAIAESQNSDDPVFKQMVIAYFEAEYAAATAPAAEQTSARERATAARAAVNAYNETKRQQQELLSQYIKTLQKAFYRFGPGETVTELRMLIAAMMELDHRFPALAATFAKRVDDLAAFADDADDDVAPLPN
jgi:lipopolysaccharide biosynthesis regulator YciM